MPHLNLLATAIAGRRLAVRQRFSPYQLASCDGHTINIDDPSDWQCVVAQAALIAAGSLDPTVLRALIGQPRTARRYCAFEVARALTIARDRVPPSVSVGVLALSRSPAESLALARSRAVQPDPPHWFGTVRPLAVLRRSRSHADDPEASNRDAGTSPVAARIGAHGDDDAHEESILLKLLRNPFSRRNAGNSLLGSLLGAGSAGGGAGGLDDAPIGRIATFLSRAPAGVALSADRQPLDLAPAIDHSLLLPEWDAASMTHRPDWVCGAMVDSQCDEARHVKAPLPLEPSTDPASLARQLSSLGLEHGLRRGQRDGTDLDTDALIDVAVDLRLGCAVQTPLIYRASQRYRRELAVAIALDVSGSTADQDESGVSTFERHRNAAASLAEAFDRLGAPATMFGFQSWGRKLFRILRLKAGNERFDGAVLDRIDRLEPVGFTRLGAAIRYGTSVLASGGHASRLLIVMTDGVLFDQGYELEYALQDARRALSEAYAAGVACLGLAVGTSVDPAQLAAIFDGDMIVAGDLGQVLPELVIRAHKAIAAASLRSTENAVSRVS